MPLAENDPPYPERNDKGRRLEKIYGIGSIDNKEERYTREIIQWAVHLFGKEKVVDINSQTDMPSVDEVLRSLGSAFDLPRNLGRLTRFLLSPDKKQRLKGLQVLHRRFWHAKLPDMKLLLERGGVDIRDDEIIIVIKACPVCRSGRSRHFHHA